MAVSVAEIVQARQRIRAETVLTPLIEHAELNAATGGRVLMKAENLQRTGSFKFRGAFNRLAQLSPAERAAGVVAWSSGNHAQGIAAAAQILGIRATIVMPSDAPAVKTANTRRYGAEIVAYDRARESREEIGYTLSRERGAVLVPSYDDEYIIAGQGTAGAELLEQAEQREAELDQLLVCCGGGGLISGIATVFAANSPQTCIYSVEPAQFDDTARSLQTGQLQRNAAGAHSICDALLAPTPGDITFAINRRYLAGGLSVTDDEVGEAMRFAFQHLKLVIEPGGAVALAAVLAGKITTQDRTTAIVLSGGNVDPEQFATIIQG